MRVSELANELGKTSKEVLDVIKTERQALAALFAASSVSEDQEHHGKEMLLARRTEAKGRGLQRRN